VTRLSRRRSRELALQALYAWQLGGGDALEQLRALEHGIAIGVEPWMAADPVIEVDVVEDLERARAALSGRTA